MRCKLCEGVSSSGFDDFVDAFIADAIERQGLVFGGGGSPTREWNGVVSRDHRYESTTEAHREAVSAWLKERSEVASFSISPPWDIWHGNDPLDTPTAIPS